MHTFAFDSRFTLQWELNLAAKRSIKWRARNYLIFRSICTFRDATALVPTRPRAESRPCAEHFLKLGAQVIVTVRRVVLHTLPFERFQAYRDSFHRLALSLGAQTG